MPNVKNNKEDKAHIEQFLSMFIDQFNSPINDHQKGNISKTAALLLCARSIANVLHALNVDSKDGAFKCDDFKKLILDNVGAKHKTLKKHYDYGCLIEGIFRFGSSKNQAVDAIGRWLGVNSNTTLHNAHMDYIYLSGNRHCSNEDFIHCEHDHILHFLSDIKDEFPDKFPKASPAFERLVKACKDETERKIVSSQPQLYSVRPYDL